MKGSNSHFGRDAERLASFRSCSHPIQQLHFVLPIPTIRKLRAAVIMRIAAPTRIYTLGTAGREYGEKALGLTIDWHFRPDRARFTGFHHLQHNLALTRVLVAAARFGKVQDRFRLTQMRTGYELAREQKLRALPAIPDAWLEFERTQDGK